MSVNRSDKILGLIYGLSVGDQIGGPIRMALELSKAILDKRQFDEKSILRHYYTWWREAGFDAGTVTHNVFMEMKRGNPNKEAVMTIHQKMSNMTGGCNPMHRAVPLALLHDVILSQLAEYAMIEAQLTHFDPIAGECSGFVILVCRHLLEGQTIEKALSYAYSMISADSPLKEELYDVIHFDKNQPKLDKPLSNIGYSPDVLRASLYFLQANNTFESSITSAFAFAGANNYCPIVVGAIAGTYYGYSQIPQNLLNQHPILANDLNTITQDFITS